MMKDRRLTNCFGRTRLFLDRCTIDLLDAAYNFIPQSNVADLTNEFGISFLYYRQDLFKELELLNQVHDSLVFQIPIGAGWDRHATMLKQLKDSLEIEIKWRTKSFRIPVTLKMGLNLGDAVKVDLTRHSIPLELVRKYKEIK